MFTALLLLVVAPLVELLVLVQVARLIGGWEAIGLLLLVSVCGVVLLKAQGLITVGRISQAAHEGRVPGRELLDGFLLVVAGLLLFVPGLVSGVVGLVLLLPPTRAAIRGMLTRRFRAGRYGSILTGSFPGGGRFIGTFAAGGVHDVTGRDAGEATDDDPPQIDP